MVKSVTIDKLPSTDTVGDSDLLIVQNIEDGVTRKITKLQLFGELSEDVGDILENYGTRSIVPELDTSYDMGTPDNRWRNLYINGTLYADDISGVLDSAEIGLIADSAIASTVPGLIDSAVSPITDVTVYVDDYGAVGDGVTDDTAAIKAAIAAAFDLNATDKNDRPWQGYRKLQFGINKKYKISETLDLQGSLSFLDDPDGQPNYYGANVDIDFGGSTILPTIAANPVMNLWGQSAVYSNLYIDPREYCTDEEIWNNKLVGVRLSPNEQNEMAGFPATYNSTYDRIIIYRSYRGFEMPTLRNFLYRCKFQFCEATSFDYGFWIDCNSLVGDGTSNAFQQCHVRAGDAKVGKSNGGVDYWCIQTHTSSAATEPGVGADWEDYWVAVDWKTGGGTYPAWTTSTFYTGAGKGYYLRGGAIFSFTGHNSVDGCIPHRNNVGPAITAEAPAALVITGGLHLEQHYVAKDYVPLINLQQCDASIDQIYVVGCAFEAPNKSVLIGSAPSPIVFHNGVYYQVKANHAATADKEPGVGANWTTYWNVLSETPEYAGDWKLDEIYRVLQSARSVTLNQMNIRGFVGEPFDNFVQVNMDRMQGVNLGVNYVQQYIIGEPETYSFILRNIVGIRQFKQVSSPTANYTFVPTDQQSGTHFRYDVPAPYGITMDVSSGPDVVDGAYFELCCVSSGNAYTDQAGFSAITGSAGGNVQGPKIARNGQTLCIQKHQGVYLTWIKPTSGYRDIDISGEVPGINSVYTPKLDEYESAELPPVSRWQGHMVMQTDGAVGYAPAFCDGSSWIQLLTTSDALDSAGAIELLSGLSAGVQNILPQTTNTYNLGSPSKIWNNIYADDYFGNASNMGGRVDSDGIKALLSTGGVNNVLPVTDSTYNLGSVSKAWNNIYADDYFGNASNMSGRVDSDGIKALLSTGGVNNVLPVTDATYNLGSASKSWNNIYADNFFGSASNLSERVDSAGVKSLLSTGGVNDILPETDSAYDLGSVSKTWDNVYANRFIGDGSQLTGVVADGSSTSTNEYVVYVDDYGTVGDGVADDTAAIKAAIAAAFDLNATDKNDSPWQGYRKLQFGIRKKYKISETLDLQGALAFLADPDGQPNYYGANVDIDFGGSTILPTIAANPVMNLWGQTAVYSNLEIDPREYCTTEEIWNNRLVGVRLCPDEENEMAGFPATYNCTYDRITVYNTWRAFEMLPSRNFLYRCKFQFCQATSYDFGFYMNCGSLVGDGTTNAFQQCHVRAGDAKVGRQVGGVDYWCIQTHTSSAATQPGIGADWEEYWVVADWYTGGGTYPAWSSGTFYTGAGKGYYIRSGAIFTFTGHNSCDGCIPHRNNIGPALDIDSPSSVVVSGGLHLEGHYVAKDYVPLINISGADFYADQIYLAGVGFNAPNKAVLIGSQVDPIVTNGGTLYQLTANHAATADTEPGVGANWTSYWTTYTGSTPKYVSDWTLNEVGGYRLRPAARNVHLFNIDKVQTPNVPNVNYTQIDMDHMSNVSLGLGYFKDFIIGEPDGDAYISRNVVGLRQFVQVSSPTANYTFVPTSQQSGTHFRYNVGLPYGITMDVSSGPDVVDGAYFELCCISSGNAYTDQAGFSAITGSANGNVQGPKEARNGQTLCIQKHQGVYLTWIKPTAGYRDIDIVGEVPGINSVYTSKLDEYGPSEVPPVSRWQGHMIMLDSDALYAPAYCDGTNWVQLATLADAAGGAGGITGSPAPGVKDINIDQAQAEITMSSSGSLHTYMEFFGSVAQGDLGGAIGQINNVFDELSFTTSSDYRIKENVSPLVDALVTVNNLNPVTYNLIGRDRTTMGFLAHELQQFVPTAVVGEKDAVDSDGNPIMQGVDYSKVVPVLTGAIKDLSALVDQLTSRIEALENGA